MPPFNHCFVYFTIIYLNRLSTSCGWNGTIRMSITRSAWPISMYRRPCAVRWFYRLSRGWRWGAASVYVLQNGEYPCNDETIQFPSKLFDYTFIFNYPINLLELPYGFTSSGLSFNLVHRPMLRLIGDLYEYYPILDWMIHTFSRDSAGSDIEAHVFGFICFIHSDVIITSFIFNN